MGMRKLTVKGATPPGEESWLWHTAAWRSEVARWASKRLDELGIQAIGHLEQLYSRPYATIMRVSTLTGVVWCKANAPGYRHEAEVLQELASWSQGRTLPLLAADVNRGWFLSRDAGPSLEQVLDADLNLRHWETVLHEYANLQVTSQDHIVGLLASGVPDKSAQALPTVLEEILKEPGSLIGPEPGLNQGEYDALLARIPQFREWCRRLADIGVPDTLQQDDLTPANVLMPSSQPVFIDWTDGCISHPFASLTYPVRHIMERFRVSADSPEVRRAKDAYLEPWTGTYDRSALQEAEELASRLAIVSKVTAWRSGLQSLERTALDPYFVHAEARWLRKLLTL